MQLFIREASLALQHNPNLKPIMPNTKGGQEVTRQTFSMHPDLMEAIIATANAMNQERAASIVQDRSQRVSYSKVVATLAWLLRTRYRNEEGEPNEQWKELLERYEATDYEKPDGRKPKRKPKPKQLPELPV